MTAITNSTWMIPPVAYPPKKLIAQMITRITATKYKIFPIIAVFSETLCLLHHFYNEQHSRERSFHFVIFYLTELFYATRSYIRSLSQQSIERNGTMAHYLLG